MSRPSAPGLGIIATFFMVPIALLVAELILSPYALLVYWVGKDLRPEEMTTVQRIVSQVMGFVGLALLVYVFVKVFGWMARRRLRLRRNEAMQQALAYVEWRNTWICTTCGAATVATRAVSE